MQAVCAMLGEKDKSLVKLAQEHVPSEEFEMQTKGKKRKSGSLSESSRGINNKKKPPPAKKNANEMTLGEREDYAIQALFEFVEQNGGSRESVANFNSRVTRKTFGWQIRYELL